MHTTQRERERETGNVKEKGVKEARRSEEKPLVRLPNKPCQSAYFVASCCGK